MSDDLYHYIIGFIQGVTLCVWLFTIRRWFTAIIPYLKERWTICMHEVGHATVALACGAKWAEPRMGVKDRPSRVGFKKVAAQCAYEGIEPNQHTAAGGDACTAVFMDLIANPMGSTDRETCEGLGYDYGSQISYVAEWLRKHKGYVYRQTARVFFFGKARLDHSDSLPLRQSWEAWLIEHPAPSKRAQADRDDGFLMLDPSDLPEGLRTQIGDILSGLFRN